MLTEHMDKFIKVAVKTYYLETKQASSNYTPDKLRYEIVNPTVEQYLDVYKQIGGPWGWAGRLMLTHDQLKEKIHGHKNHILFVYYEDLLCGLVELEHQNNEVEIVYYGLDQEFIGKGLGKELGELTLAYAWSLKPTRVWLHTCEYDHPKALQAYIKMGMVQYKEQVDHEEYSEKYLKLIGKL